MCPRTNMKEHVLYLSFLPPDTHASFQLPPRDYSRSLTHWSQHRVPSQVPIQPVLLSAFWVILPKFSCTELTKYKIVAPNKLCFSLCLLLLCTQEGSSQFTGHAGHEGEGVWSVFPPHASQRNACLAAHCGVHSPPACGGGTKWEYVGGCVRKKSWDIWKPNNKTENGKFWRAKQIKLEVYFQKFLLSLRILSWGS